MIIDSDPFTLLEQWQYAGTGDGNIIFLDKSIPDEEKELIRVEYRKWWEKKQKTRIETGWI